MSAQLMKCEDRVVVFAGPSLPPTDRSDDPMFVWRPPAAAGDAFALDGLRPRAVVLIDGLFDEQPSIRHKELLTLIAQGVTVIGGASMGALRAAELSAFGMIGVGQIYEAYARGYLVGDDEVAVLHGPEELDWSPLTEPLVNVRATILRAVRDMIIDMPTARLALRAANHLFYKDRTWPAILQVMRTARGATQALEDWLPVGRVDLKRQDALGCLEVARSFYETEPAARPFPPQTMFSDALAAQVRGL